VISFVYPSGIDAPALAAAVALANAGLHIDSRLLAAAATSPITWGIVPAYAVGKPVGIVVAASMASKRATLRLTPRELRGTPLSAGVGFTVSLLIASRAFDGAQLDQAKLAIMITAVIAPVLALAALRVPVVVTAPRVA
jgi:Na+/H+ antiporter NhaA